MFSLWKFRLHCKMCCTSHCEADVKHCETFCETVQRGANVAEFFWWHGRYIWHWPMKVVHLYWQVRSLHVILMSQTDSESFSRGNKRRLYTLLVIAVAQPLLMWWLTRRLTAVEWTKLSSVGRCHCQWHDMPLMTCCWHSLPLTLHIWLHLFTCVSTI